MVTISCAVSFEMTISIGSSMRVFYGNGWVGSTHEKTKAKTRRSNYSQ